VKMTKIADMLVRKPRSRDSDMVVGIGKRDKSALTVKQFLCHRHAAWEYVGDNERMIENDNHQQVRRHL